MSGTSRPVGRGLLVEIRACDFRALLVLYPVGCALAHDAVSAACYDADNLKCYRRPFGAECLP